MKRRKPLLAAVLLALGSHASAAPFDQPAQDLGLALGQLARAASLQLVAPPELVAGLQAQGVRNASDLRAALAQLLAGTGLQAHVEGDTLIVQAAPRTATLPAVTVRATHERGGQTEGTGSYTTDGTRATTGLNLSLRETPQSVTVVTRQRMDDQALESLAKVLDKTTGLYITGSGSALPANGRSEIYSRGYEIQNYQIDGLPTTGWAWSDGSNSKGANSLDTAIYDSVTVVRGATGLLNGAGDPGGSVNLVRKRPTQDFQASIEGALGRWDAYRAVGDISGPLNAAGTLRGRLVGAYSETDLWVDRYQAEKKLAYGVLEADLGDRTKIVLAMEHSKAQSSNSHNVYGYPLLYSDGSLTPFSRHDNGTADWGKWSLERTVLSVALEHSFNEDWHAKLNYSRTEGSSADLQGMRPWRLNPDGSGSAYTFETDQDTETDSFNASLNGKYWLWGRPHELVAGINGSFSDLTKYKNALGFADIQVSNGRLFFPQPDDWSALNNYSYKLNEDQYGFYLASRLRPTDRLALTLGGRLTTWKTKSSDLPNATYYDPENPVTDDREEKEVFIPYAGIVYALTEQLSAYASYTEIFQPQSSEDRNGRFLDPEEGKNYELGLKGEWFNGRLNASAAIFEVHKDNLAVRDGDARTPNGNQAYRAADDTKGQGWEIEVAGQLAAGWQLQAGYTRIVTRDSDKQRLNTERPIHLFKLFSAYTPHSQPRLTVGGGVNWQSKRSTVDEGRLYTQKSHSVVDLMARYAFNDKLNLAINLNNAFDKTYRTDLTHHEYGAERNLTATLKYQF